MLGSGVGPGVGPGFGSGVVLAKDLQDASQGLSSAPEQLVTDREGAHELVAEASLAYPADRDVVNVASLRHLWVLDEPPTYAWRKP